MKKKRKTSITLGNDVINWIQKQIERKRFRSVSHAIEYAIYQLIEKEKGEA